MKTFLPGKAAVFFTTLLAASSAFAQSTNYTTRSSGGGGIGALIELVVLVFLVIGLWKVFTKAGRPGWASIIPIYNVYILCQIAGKPGWWVVLWCIPIVNFVIAIIVMIELAKAFGKGAGFGLGLVFLSFIFIPLLGFGDAQYLGRPS